MPETTDPTFYRSPGAAIAAPPEQLAYVAAFDPAGQAKDADQRAAAGGERVADQVRVDLAGQDRAPAGGDERAGGRLRAGQR